MEEKEELIADFNFIGNTEQEWIDWGGLLESFHGLGEVFGDSVDECRWWGLNTAATASHSDLSRWSGSCGNYQRNQIGTSRALAKQ